MAESYSNQQKILWEKEKLLITSNFSFSNSVFKRLVSQGRQMVSLCGNGLYSQRQIQSFEKLEMLNFVCKFVYYRQILTDMPILGSFYSATNKDMMSKILTNLDRIF